mgnify:CR=1 FL=1
MSGYLVLSAPLPPCPWTRAWCWGSPASQTWCPPPGRSLRPPELVWIPGGPEDDESDPSWDWHYCICRSLDHVTIFTWWLPGWFFWLIFRWNSSTRAPWRGQWTTLWFRTCHNYLFDWQVIWIHFYLIFSACEGSEFLSADIDSLSRSPWPRNCWTWRAIIISSFLMSVTRSPRDSWVLDTRLWNFLVSLCRHETTMREETSRTTVHTK